MRPRHSSLPVLVLSLCFSIPAFVSPRAEPPSSTNSAAAPALANRNPDDAIWIDGELAPPLPKDPEKRAAAIEEARRRGKQRNPDGAPLAVSTHPLSAPIAIVDLRKQSTATSHAGKSDAPSIATAPGLITSFDGIDDTGATPPSPDIAVGADHVILTAHDRMEIRDKCNNTLVAGDFQDLFGLPGGRSYYGGRVLYDEWDDRWIIAYVATNIGADIAAVYLAVSFTGDAMGLWYLYEWDYSADLTAFPDDLRLAVDPDYIYVVGTNFNINTFALLGSYVRWASKSSFYAGNADFYFSIYLNLMGAIPIAGARPAEPRTFTNKMYFVATRPAGGSDLTVWTRDGFVVTSTTVPYIPYGVAPNIQQPNATYVDAFDTRVTDAIYYVGRLHMVWTEAAGLFAKVVEARLTTSPLAWTSTGIFGSINACYPGFDIEANGAKTLAYAIGNSSTFLSLEHTTYTDFSNVEQIFGYGLANYAGGGAGTNGDPYRWGTTTGVARDPVDKRTMWLHGPIASNSPIPSWETKVGLVSAYEPSILAFNDVSQRLFWGFSGGPFQPAGAPITLQNAGGVSANWCAYFPSWLDVSSVSGSIAPGGSQVVTMTLNAEASTLPPGIYDDFCAFVNYSGYGGYAVPVRLSVGENGLCQPSSSLILWPAANATFTPVNNDERGVYITAIRDANLCAVGVLAAFDVPQTLTARVYQANGLARGALLAQGSIAVVNPNLDVHHVPLSAPLSACQDYDVAFTATGSPGIVTWDDTAVALPFDVGGMVRVRDGEHLGNAATSTFPGLLLLAEPTTCASSIDLALPFAVTPTNSNYEEHGMYVRMTRSAETCTIGWETSLVPGAILRVRVFEAAGSVRGAFVAGGSIVVSATGLRFHDVPVRATMLEGRDYNITFEHDNFASWNYVPAASLPYTFPTFTTVLAASGADGAIEQETPHVRVYWDDDAIGGAPFDLAKQGDVYPPPYSSSLPIYYGLYVTPLVGTELYGIGLMADIPADEAITARVFEANGTTRGALISQTTLYSHAAGMTWHDVPVSASLVANGDYDIEMQVDDVNLEQHWIDSFGLPYTAYGWLRVNDAEQGGDGPGSATMIHMRVHACNETATAVADSPLRSPLFLGAPAPNPTAESVTFRYGLDIAGRVEVAVYDVTGKLVETVVSSTAAPAGPGRVEFDTRRLPSGVYFCRLTTTRATMSRKFVVVH